ncbi:ThuA domain-containing protein [Nakamurella sp. YIM 132087]|uniref:ThuA domain-containing protein n=1 Tax=Nakamurella alba TaxID=2665158 RepID=A0A7K1FIF1_9ACTN|nr:ThuA domain-containing protein [Nakamurella alba]MTD13892.1 ThuA domain-containing protein [Nakamurella alba]
MPPVGRRALVVRGGWPGHSPVEATEVMVPFLRAEGFDVTVRDDLDCYTEPGVMDGLSLVVQCWTMGRISEEQASGLIRAVAGGTGFAGWHGGIADSFRSRTEYLQLVGGQFVAHPGGFVDHTIEVVPERADHPVVAGLPSPFALHTEQYWVLTDDLVDVLATTTIPPGEFWDRPVTCPAVWTRNWGAGRVFVCTVGHHPADLLVPEIRGLLERGLLWAAR